LENTECTLCAATEEARKLSMQHINQHNSDIIQDNADLLELEKRYNSLHIPHTTRRIIDDYIACILSRQERMESLIYYAGFNNAQNG
jgi:UDP-N-acetylglucosamine:LPS N-acetylglucosamine transferase